MAGTLVVSTLSDGTNSTSATNPILGSAKAWINFNGTLASIRASYNVTSLTYNAAGDYTINFTNALADTNYAVIGGSCNWNQGQQVNLGVKYSTGITYNASAVASLRSTTQVEVVTGVGNSASLLNTPEFDVVIFR
jgi:hypothetical protein